VRALACDEVMKTAKDEHRTGDLADSLRLVKLAHELDPTDDEANKHLSEYQADFDKSSQLSPAGDTSASTAKPGTLGATVDLSPAAARVGQGVSLVAHMTTPASAGPKPRIDGAEFVVTAPGYAAVHVPALLEPSGALDATYTWKRAGKYTVTFDARVGGAAVTSSRAIDIAAPNAPLAPVAPGPAASGVAPAVPTATATASAPPVAPDPPPVPSATGSGKWL
jgi:hypothetical protein